MSGEIHVKGLAELYKAMDELTDKLEKNIMRGAMTAGARAIANQAKAICPLEPANMASTYKKTLGWKPGDLRKSIRVSSNVRNAVASSKVVAGNKKAYYARFVEFGTAQHWIRPKGAKSLFFAGLMREAIDHPGARKNPFMRIAMDSRSQQAVVAVGEYMKARLTQEGINVAATDVGDAGDEGAA